MFSILSKFFLFALIPLGVLSKNATFTNVKVQFQTDDYIEAIVDITASFKEELPAEKITRLTIVGDSNLPVIKKGTFLGFTQLRIIQIRQHGVEEIEPEAFKKVPLLEILRLQGNKLEEIEGGVFTNPSLKFLNLDHNSIENISSQAFENLPKLEVLDLSNNRLKNFDPEWITNKPALSTVILAYNQIEFLPDGALENYHRGIDFSNNRLRNISRSIFGSGEYNFGDLWLADNGIQEWEENLLENVTLATIDLSRNRLECLDGNLDNYFVAYKTRIDGNPWKCECVEKIVEWMTQQESHRVEIRSSAKKCADKEKN